MTRYTYNAEQTGPGSSLTVVLSAEWDTRRDAALAARIRYDLTPGQMDDLIRGKTVSKNNTVIKLQSADPEQI